MTERRPKYGNRKVTIDGLRFDSVAESRRYATLLYLEMAGEIRDLECHPPYRLVVNGVLIGRYTPDFRYVETASGRTVVEDVKSRPTKTRDYVLRKKLMKALHGIEIQEVTG